MVSILQYPFITPFDTAVTIISAGGSSSPLFEWLVSGKIVENPIVRPSNQANVIIPSAVNRSLGSITVLAQVPKVYERTIVVGTTTAVSIDGTTTADSDNTGVATAAVGGTTTTITGVAANTTAVRIYDANNSLIGIVVVTVTEATPAA